MDMNQMLKQAQKMQQNVMKVKEETERLTVTATSGGGIVEVVVSGKMRLESLKIKPEAIDPDDPEMLEDMVKAAVNRGLDDVQSLVEQEMSKATGGMNIPGLI
jgi:DNA-binding YbaB/EbfC family protein